MRLVVLFAMSAIVFSCNSVTDKSKKSVSSDPSIKVVGSMRNVMWKGALEGTIDLDTIRNREGLYGLGPAEYLVGELLIIDGKSYKGTVMSDSTMHVEESNSAKSPFFVYANASVWNEKEIPERINSIRELEAYIDHRTSGSKRPFVFKLTGRVEKAKIHLQNLPKGTLVKSPDDAHQGKNDYFLENTNVSIVGFYSTEHKGIFTHHDSNVHMHLITEDKTKLGHLDDVNFRVGKMKLFLPAAISK